MAELLVWLLVAFVCFLIGALIVDAWRQPPLGAEEADPEERIRKLAHQLWEAEGRPSGAQERHWRAAEAMTATYKATLSGTSAIEKLQFQSDVAEVQLLLDFISGRPDLSLNGMAAAKPGDPANVAPGDGGVFNFVVDPNLERMAALRYPPDPRPGQSSKDVAFLLEFRDHLNRLVAPASGLTIAFTLLTWNTFSLWILQQAASFFLRRRPKEDWARWSLANQAYPRLKPSVFFFRLCSNCLMVLAIAVTLVSLWSSHEVADGQARINRAAALDHQRGQLILTIEQLNNIVPTGAVPAAAASGAGVPVNPTITAPGPTVADLMCGRIGRAAAESQLPTQVEVEKTQNCDDLLGVTDAQWRTYTAMRTWWIAWRNSLLVSGVEKVKDRFTGQTPPDWATIYKEETRPADVYTAPSDSLPTALAEEMSDITKVWLPALYGLVGAVVAALRSIYTKISTSTLAPWDARLMLTRMILGMLAGTCVGLFFSPDGTTVDGVPGIGNLSLSALAFLAGYAVDGLFAVLDDLIQRVFHGGGPAGAQKRAGVK